MSVNPNFPVYLGVSQEYFLRMQQLNILDGDARLTVSESQAQTDAKAFGAHCEEKMKQGLGGIGPVLTSLVRAPAEITSSKVRGIIVKFDTEKLLNNFTLLEFGTEVRVATEVINNVMMYVSGFYEVVDIEELVEGDLYA